MIDPRDLAKQVLEHLKGFNLFNMLKHTLSYLIVLVFVIIVLFYLLLVGWQVLKKKIHADRLNLHQLWLQLKKEGRELPPPDLFL